MSLAKLIERIDALVTKQAPISSIKPLLTTLSEQVEALEKKVADFEQEKAALEKSIADLNSQVAAMAETKQFVEHRGALFKRKGTGGYDLAVYCPLCRGPMTSVMDATPFMCLRDNTTVSFTGSQLSAVMRDLPK